jgi:CRISPR/Cas system CMR-associated protein Cmr1 (group 7 of RAMP superfamily)
MSKRFDVYERKENKFTKNSQKKFKLAMNPDVKKKCLSISNSTVDGGGETPAFHTRLRTSLSKT